MTPGVISLAPGMTEREAHVRDAAGLPLGQWLQGARSGLFPGKQPLSQTQAVGAALAVAIPRPAFPGILADPPQAYHSAAPTVTRLLPS